MKLVTNIYKCYKYTKNMKEKRNCVICNKSYYVKKHTQKCCLSDICKSELRKQRQRRHYYSKTSMKWRKENIERIRDIKRKYKKSEKGKKAESKYRKTPFRKIVLKRYRENNKDIIRKRNKNWEKTLPGKIKHRREVRKRQIKLKNIKENFTNKQWLDKVKITKGICPKCKEKVGLKNIEMDHIIPISKVPNGHIYSINDVQPLCKKCNSKKGNRYKT